jgi:hypothetical protein
VEVTPVDDGTKLIARAYTRRKFLAFDNGYECAICHHRRGISQHGTGGKRGGRAADDPRESCR